jgi:hypothetical protein
MPTYRPDEAVSYFSNSNSQVLFGYFLLVNDLRGHGFFPFNQLLYIIWCKL